MERTQQFDQFVQNTFNPTLAFVRRRVRDHWAAADIVQSAYTDLLADPAFDAGLSGAPGYLRCKVNWLILDHFRQRECWPRFAESEEREQPSPEQAVLTAETVEAVRRAIGQLPRKYQDVLLRWLDGMSHKQTADDLGMPLRRVYRLFYEAKQALHRQLPGSTRDLD